jgi:LCP family protein required for cell wall assembly
MRLVDSGSAGARRRSWRSVARRGGRLLALTVVLALTAVLVPDSGVSPGATTLVKVDRAEGVDHHPRVIWILALGSDARPGQSVVRTRADAIQLVGINTRTGDATAIGIPRDSWVNVPGHGNNKINAAMYYGGPQLMASAVAGMVGIKPDYVFVAGFKGFTRMVDRIGGVTVHSRYAFSDPVRPQGYKVGKNRLNGIQTMIFSRLRKPFPRGDFDRSANQQRTLLAILREVRGKSDRLGFMERGVLAAVHNMRTGLPPWELYRLAQAAARVKPAKFRGCVVGGRTGYVGAASVVFANVSQARSIASRARRDARLEGSC